MNTLPELSWDARTEPNLQIWDQSGLSPLVTGFNLLENHDTRPEYIEWLNGFRRPLYNGSQRSLPPSYNDLLNPNADTEPDYRLRYPPQPHYEPQATLTKKGVFVMTVAKAVAAVSGTRDVPAHRVLMSGDARKNPNYQRAAAEVPSGRQLPGDGRYEYNPLLGTILLQDKHVEESGAITAVNTLAMALGEAATGNIVDVKLSGSPATAQHWHGYPWHARGHDYGRVLQMAQTTKIAALARSRLGIVTPGEPARHPLLEPYRLESGYCPETGAAVAVDLLEWAGVKNGHKSIYGLICDFAKRGRPAEVRDELASCIQDVTKGRLSLHLLERIIPQTNGGNVEVVELVEDALKIRTTSRPSVVLRQTEGSTVETSFWRGLIRRRYAKAT